MCATTTACSSPSGAVIGADAAGVTAVLRSAERVAQDAKFTLNGIDLVRKSNTVTDAVDGVTFNLKQGAQPTATTFTVALDKSAITSAMQDAVSKFNAMLKVYKDASGTGGALANDPSVRSIVSQVRAALAGIGLKDHHALPLPA